MSIEPKPCPFCGGPAGVERGGFGERFVVCKNDQCGGGLGGGIWFTTDKAAIAVWNKRPKKGKK